MRYWTGIGSRGIDQRTYDIMFKIGQEMAKQGYILRSGNAQGSDMAFETGVCSVDPSLTDIWIPWKSFGTKNKGVNYSVPSVGDFNNVAKFLKEPRKGYPNGILPWYDKMSQGAQKLHCRNYFQVLGNNGKLSKVCIYAAPEDDKGNIMGGTRTAVEIARYYGVPTFNLLIPEDLHKVKDILKMENL